MILLLLLLVGIIFYWGTKEMYADQVVHATVGGIAGPILPTRYFQNGRRYSRQDLVPRPLL
jgi:hypothetical protein